MIAKTPNLMYRLNLQVTAYGRQTVPDRGVASSCDPIIHFWCSNHITGTAEPKVVKFCTRVGYINSSDRMTCHQHKGRGYGHVTILKFCRLSWCSATRGFVSDSWATCVVGAAIGLTLDPVWLYVIIRVISRPPCYRILLCGLFYVHLLYRE